MPNTTIEARASSADVLKVLIKKRGSLKAKLTQFDKFVSTFEGLEIDDKIRVEVVQLEQRINNAEKILCDFDIIQNEIECLADDPEVHYAEREEFENKFHSVLARSKTQLDNLNSESEDAKSSASAGHTSGACSTSLDGIKLPEIELPKFDGSYNLWMEFRDTFESLIHTNSQINNIQKFHYLRASLVGSASQVIQSLEFAASNYAIAWDTLCDRFNNKPLLVQNHLKSIFEMENITVVSATKIRNLYENLFKHLASLKQLNEPTDSWDTLIIFIIASKLDKITAQEWEKQKSLLTMTGAVTLTNFKDFLKKRANLLETVELNFDNSKSDKSFYRQDSNRDVNANRKNAKPTYFSRGLLGQSESKNDNAQRKFKYICFNCKGEHSLFYCPDFLKLSIKDRIAKVKSLKLCLNCFRKNHIPRDCTWSGCKTCGNKHNTVLHENKAIGNTNKNNQNSENHNDIDQIASSSSNMSNTLLTVNQNTILSTAKVHVRNKSDSTRVATMRALLDCGSQSSYITTELCRKLNLEKFNTNLAVSGISDSLTYAKYKCDIQVESLVNAYNFNLSCFVLDKITSDVPHTKIDIEQINIPVDIKLADPDFFEPRTVDLLIGVDAFWNLLCVGQIKLGKNAPLLQNTRLGWIVAGIINSPRETSQCNLSLNHSLNDLLQNQLKKFWEIEEIDVKNSWSLEEQACEDHFNNTIITAEDGRYVVSLPLKKSPELLGDSRERAMKQFLSLERKLMLNPILNDMYSSFLNEYENLGHMTEIKNMPGNQIEYYMPHHGVLKASSTTTKLRVVFNASCPTSTGVSLNDLQMTGPTIQNDLLSIILRFRTQAIVLSSDIKMMYRQVLLKPEQRCLQQIFWRYNPNESIKTFQLNTVTYGTTAASFLAIRCLHQIASECEKDHPNIANIIRNDMYVDDLLTSVNTREEAKYVCENISSILLRRGFELRKWKSNDKSVISGLSNDETANEIDFSINKENESKILGLSWHCERDILKYKISNFNSPSIITKRTILSRIATIFDPLGLLSPSIIIAKMLLQKMWSEKLTWDQPLPPHIRRAWEEFSSELCLLNRLEIPRKTFCDNYNRAFLHGFADASETSYGACVYIVSSNAKGEIRSYLLSAKSRVAPIKSITIPRLELSAALILAQLVSKILGSIPLKFDNIHLWSDSTIVLGWINTRPNLLKPFVANRVAMIQNLTNKFIWKHVPTDENPADIVSRGLLPRKLIDSQMWFNGPSWLVCDSKAWPNTFISQDLDLPEKRNICLHIQNDKLSFPFERFSNVIRLKRVCAYMLRFINNCKQKTVTREFSNLSVKELDNAFLRLIRIAQLESFHDEFNILRKGYSLSDNSRLLSLHSFFDKNDEILRVGGRLSNSDFSFSKKHPILLPTNHRLTQLIFEFEHRKLLHAGPQSLLANIREMFWPISGRNLARKIVKNCVRCARYSGQKICPTMGDLPATRVRPTAPFSCVGVDYAGPFIMKDRTGRGCKPLKCWVALFICFSTRAIHLELVLALTCADFLQAFNRFISRRGKPCEVFSDNGTNFVRANKELKEMSEFLKNNCRPISDFAANMNVKWHFIPPNSPHFGGIWEAGVKSVKFHIKRVLGSNSIYFFDFQTLLIRIEAILNSRPISPMSSDPSDLTALTPAHFLIGRNPTTLADPPTPDVGENRLTKYQLLQKLYEHFWKRWSTEYISELQQRSKWRKQHGHVELNQLVLVKDDNLPPSMWRLGRVISLKRGTDGISRVASIRTADGTITRAIIRLCPLPVVSGELPRPGACLGHSVS